MAFESLSHRHVFPVSDFPPRWLPLYSLYDPDLPLFPVTYFHSLTKTGPEGRPSYQDRVFGYIERMNLEDDGAHPVLNVHVACNKNLASDPALAGMVEQRLRGMLGLANPVTIADVRQAFSGQMAPANGFLVELWERVVGSSYGGMLPFGPIWDPVFGLARWVASFFSESGRKGELIQTHYFVSRFGERIQSGGGLPQNDFFLLPTFEEITDQSNPLNIFPKYRDLLRAVREFARGNTLQRKVGRLTLSWLSKPPRTRLSKGYIERLASGMGGGDQIREVLNAFGKGGNRTVVFLLLLNDIIEGRLVPGQLTPADVGSLYDEFSGSHQSPKVIVLYAQQCFGNAACIPIDNWISTFFRYPLLLYGDRAQPRAPVMAGSLNLGKVERLLWVSAQARKVHSSACSDAIWCTKYSAKRPRGANPLACNICILTEKCPAFSDIADLPVVFNANAPRRGFSVRTSAGNNHATGQRFTSLSGRTRYGRVQDDESPRDGVGQFAEFPGSRSVGQMTVRQFVETY